jgi:hypothetical protein
MAECGNKDDEDKQKTKNGVRQTEGEVFESTYASWIFERSRISTAALVRREFQSAFALEPPMRGFVMQQVGGGRFVLFFFV